MNMSYFMECPAVAIALCLFAIVILFLLPIFIYLCNKWYDYWEYKK
jgi:hypothetical protein